MLPCGLLGEADCRRRVDCAADSCFHCSCSPEFQGCRATTAPMHTCVGYGCAQPFCCHTSADCSGALQCGPTTQRCGGACSTEPGNCSSDQDCLQNKTGLDICEPMPCACAGQRQCVPGCAKDSDCPFDQTCNAGTGHCAPRPCSATVPCPDLLTCGTRQVCEPRLCTSDAECPAKAYCVERQCRPDLGMCLASPP